MKSVVITGSSTGIGRATALHLDAQGWRVFAGVRKREDGASLQAEASDRLEPVILDVADAASIEAADKEVSGLVGLAGLDGLVNNAGIGVGGPLEYLPLDELRRQLEVNVVGPVAVTQAFLPLLRRATGRVVIVGSIGGRNAAPIAGPYAMSKHAMEAFADSLRQELRPWELHVALIEPGAIDTKIFEKTGRYASEQIGSLDEDALSRYRGMIDAVTSYFVSLEKSAISPLHVARAIEHALTASRPKTRYLVGTDARVQAAMRALLPDHWRDAVMSRLLGLPKKGSRQRGRDSL